MTSQLRNFRLLRHHDTSGVSGTGWVAEGVQFTCGMVALSWLSDKHVVAIYEDMETLIRVHGHGGDTEVVFTDS